MTSACFEIKDILKKHEELTLSKYAVFSEKSLPRTEFEPPDPVCLDFEVDRDRILHCKSFRRLKHKTQVFFAPYQDHFRTRLTHTLEVSQISRAIAQRLCLNLHLTEAIALGHDLGHTPFGHTGEEVLNGFLKEGFRHADQSVRVVTLLENLNLKPETIDGIQHHSYGKEKAKTFEGQVVEISDKVAYINHDIDDAIRAKAITFDMLPSDCLEILGEDDKTRNERIICDIFKNSYNKGKVELSEETLFYIKKLRTWLFENVYFAPPARANLDEAKRVLNCILQWSYDNLTKLAENKDEDKIKRAIADYVASMSDRYALSLSKDLKNAEKDVLIKYARINKIEVTE